MQSRLLNWQSNESFDFLSGFADGKHRLKQSISTNRLTVVRTLAVRPSRGDRAACRHAPLFDGVPVAGQKVRHPGALP